MIADLLPPAVSAREAVGPAQGEGLFPDEEALVRTADAGRRTEFTAGRTIARAALAGLGLPATSIPAGYAGEPQWPAGVTGSITHCAGYRACAVARTADVAALGIDAEPDAALPRGLIGSVADDAEQAWLATLAPGVVCWDRLLFSAKEAVGKLWYPRTGRWPAFGEFTVFPDEAGTFDVRVAGSRLTGRWLARSGLIMTAVSWPLEPMNVASCWKEPLQRHVHLLGPPRACDMSGWSVCSARGNWPEAVSAGGTTGRARPPGAARRCAGRPRRWARR